VNTFSSNLTYALKENDDNSSPTFDKFLAFAELASLTDFNENDSMAIAKIISLSSYRRIYEDYTDYSKSTDMANGGKYITVSFLSLHLEHGRAVFAHEFGHIVDQNSKLMNNPKNQARLREIKACLSELHPEKPTVTDKSSTSTETLGVYTREDFADLFSAKMLEKSPEINNGCHLLHSMEPAPLINEIPSDTHSSPFYRTLHSSIVKNGSLSPQCTTYLDQFEENETAQRIKNCWR
jgi:hypothetical protein